MRFIVLALSLFLLISCATNSKRRPAGWINDYQATSCESHKELLKQNKIAIKDIIIIKSYLVCKDLDSLPPLPEENSWNRFILNEAKLKLARHKKDDAVLIKLLKNNALQKQKQSEKISAIKKLLDHVDKLGANFSSEKQELIELISKIAPRFSTKINKEDYIKIADDHRNNREFIKAIQFYNKAIKEASFSPEVKWEAYRGIRQTYKTSQDKENFIKSHKPMTNFAKKYFSTEKVIEIQNQYARAIWTEGRVEQAKKVLNNIITEFNNEKKYNPLPSLSDTYFILARIEEEARNYKSSLDYLNKALSERPTPLQRDKILWTAAWLNRNLRQYDQAIEGFKNLKNETKDLFDKNKYCFWLAKTYRDNSQEDLARVEFENLQKEDPLGYYGLITYYELNQEIPSASYTQTEVKIPSTLATEDHEYLDSLIWINEKKIAELYIAHLWQKYKSSNSEVQFYLLKNYARIGSYLPLFAQLGTLNTETRTQLAKDHLELLFPKPYFNIVDSTENSQNVEHELIYSIMRQESAFNPMARSPMDAFGLLQLLPEVAEKYKKTLNIKYNNHEDLYDPEVNIPLGAHLLKKLFNQYDNKFILAVAAYNANDRAIAGWLATRYRGLSLEFIEDIPYEETRAYVKLVMRNYLFYKKLSTSSKSFEFPKDILKM